MPLEYSKIGDALLWKLLRLNPLKPTWNNRDRLLLSAYHGSMFLS
jgi:transketolase